MGRITSPIKKKVLLLLAGGLVLCVVNNRRAKKRIFKALKKEWKVVDKKYLYRVVREFHRDRLVDFVENKNGEATIILTEKGKKMVLRFDIDKIKINTPLRWDKKWRFVFFDVPEKRRKERNILRNKLKEIGFHEIQKSIFVHPHPCLDEINFIIEYYKLRNLVRYGEMTNISNEEELKIKFSLY